MTDTNGFGTEQAKAWKRGEDISPAYSIDPDGQAVNFLDPILDVDEPRLEIHRFYKDETDAWKRLRDTGHGDEWFAPIEERWECHDYHDSQEDGLDPRYDSEDEIEGTLRDGYCGGEWKPLADMEDVRRFYADLEAVGLI